MTLDDLTRDLFHMPDEPPTGCVETCPECMARHVTPATIETVPNGAQCHYTCHVCGCDWTTSWWEGEG